MKTTFQSNNTNMQSQTMYNLHTKRTLPRDVIKWMQGLDLSYSVKDYRKDMSNGFLIGEIVSRYEPGRIPMHSFENSSNQARRDNNWNQLQLFFSKFTLRGVQISPDEYDKIKLNQDPKSEQLYNFVCHLYSICTKRTIQENPPVLDLPPTQNPNPNLTQSYLLKDDGLEKLDNSNVQQNNISHSQMLKNSGLTEKVQDRIPTRKIATNVESGDLVDPTGVGIRAEGRKMTSKRRSWNNNFDQSNKDFMGEDEENQEPDKLIFDYMSEIMEECLPTADPTTREILFPDDAQYSATELFARNLSSLDQEFVVQFLSQINLGVDELTQILLREINETWKFFTYLLKLFRVVGENIQVFGLLCEIIGNYARNGHAKEPKRLGKVFYEALLMTLVNEVKIMNNMRRKQALMGLLYDFTGRNIEEKKTALSKLKDMISSSNILYIQWLSVLVNEEFVPESVNNNNQKTSQLLDDFVYYAQQYMSSSVVAARTAALKILLEIGKAECHMIDKYFLNKSSMFSKSRNDPEQVCLFVQIYFCLLKDLTESHIYQSLVKGIGSSNLVKSYNPDNEKITEELKTKITTISETIRLLSESTANETIRELCAKLSLSYIHESQQMMHVFLDYIYSTGQKQEFFDSNEQKYHEFKSIVIKMPIISLAQIKDHSNEILAEIIALKTNKGYEIEQFLWLINYCLENINVKKINMEFWEDVSIHIVKPYTKLITIEEYSQLASEGLIRVFTIHFSYDMKIRELPQWLTQSLNSYEEQLMEPPQSKQKKEKSAFIDHQISLLNDWLNNEYQKTKNEMISFIINEISDTLIENTLEGNRKLIKFKK